MCNTCAQMVGRSPEDAQKRWQTLDVRIQQTDVDALYKVLFFYKYLFIFSSLVRREQEVTGDVWLP